MRAELAEQIATQRLAFELFGQSLRRMGSEPWRRQEILQAMVQIGVGSVPIIAIATAFAGIVVTNEIAWHMDKALSSVAMIPGLTGQFILRELGIAIPALLLVSKVGAAITAEVGTMKVTEQIDALKLLRIDPISYLVVPRLVASTLASTCLTLISAAVTLTCAIGVSVSRYHFSTMEYVNAVRAFVSPVDLACAITKGLVFGAVVPIVGCAYGFRCKGGAQGVGDATTNSVVAATIAIILLDFILTYLFSLMM